MKTSRGGLQRRIIIAVTLGMAIILLCFGIAGYMIIQQNINESLNKKLNLARIMRDNIDRTITNNINRLYDISLSGRVDLGDCDMKPEKDALGAAYRYSIFTDGVFIVDKGGAIRLNYPARAKDISINVLSVEPIRKMLAEGKPLVSNVYTTDTNKKVIYILAPLKDKNGAQVGLAGGEIDPTNPLLSSLFRITGTLKSHIDLIDSNGVVIASSEPARVLSAHDHDRFFDRSITTKTELVTTCHECHDQGRKKRLANVMAFAPLRTAPWGVAVEEPEESVFSAAIRLRRIFLGLSIIFIATAVILTIGMARSIVNPVNDLISAADQIANGNLAMPFSNLGGDEIGLLGRRFETMRQKLAESVTRIQRHAQELETRVDERTRQIKESQKRAEELLKKVITSQEDERKRIARGLHDVTLQELSAALMKIDLCRLRPETVTPEKIENIRDIVAASIDGVHTLVQNLRPTLLDDLGLVAALKSLLQMHLVKKDLTWFLDASCVKDRRFRPEVETVLFRLLQEAIVNIARHADAVNVFVLFRCDGEIVHAEIEDDGVGFDLGALLQTPPSDLQAGRGLGILGMKERVLLVEGEMELHSEPGKGTRLVFRIPLERKEAHDAA